MRVSPLSVIAVVALLVLAGCVGAPNTGENQPSPETPPDVAPDEFANASEIGPSVFDTHATEMGNTSFTLTFQQNRTDRSLPGREGDFSHMNDTSRTLVEPNASQYLDHTTGYFSGNGSTYSNGSTEYVLSRENDWTEVRDLSPESMFNESSEYYLWRGIFNNDNDPGYDFAAIDATYEREGVEWFQGVPVMRYEATGVDALSDRWAGGENGSQNFEEFSATLLLDEDGVIRHYEYTFVKPPERHTRLRFSRTYTLSDVGSTDVEKPDWVANAAANTTSGT